MKGIANFDQEHSIFSQSGSRRGDTTNVKYDDRPLVDWVQKTLLFAHFAIDF